MNLLLADPIPRQQLNASIFIAMRPLLATMGPWNHGYGMRQDHFRVEIQVSVGEEGLQFVYVPQPSNNLPSASSVLIHELLAGERPPPMLLESASATEESAAVIYQPLSLGQEFSVATGCDSYTDAAPGARNQEATMYVLQPQTELLALPAPTLQQSPPS